MTSIKQSPVKVHREYLVQAFAFEEWDEGHALIYFLEHIHLGVHKYQPRYSCLAHTLTSLKAIHISLVNA